MSRVNHNLISKLANLKNVNWYRSEHTIKKAMDIKNKTIPILFKSKHFLVLNKPNDLIVYNFKKDQMGMPSLYDYLRENFPYYYDSRLTGGFHVLHRLDAITSGAICIPLNYFSQRLAVKAFTTGKVEKYYLALVNGLVQETDEFTINVPIGDDIKNYKFSKLTVVDRNGVYNENCIDAQEAATKVKVLEYGTYKGKPCTKLLIQPLTGRRHQIRVHLDYAGYPIVGDTAYGIGDFDSYRTMLHSYKLVINIDTKKRQFIKAKASDPFVSKIDIDYVNTSVVNSLKI